MEGLIGAAVVILYLAHAIYSAIQASAAQQAEQQQAKEQKQQSKRPKQPAPIRQAVAENLPDELTLVSRTPKKQAKRVKRRDLVPDEISAEKPLRRQPSVKELPPPGIGSRFDVAPGMLDSSQIVAPTLSTNIKPNFESLTGIYDQPATQLSTEQQTVDIFAMLSNPDGLRQAVILSEIFTRRV
ncbi:hypothetical protein FACS189454_00820 [Planctomycetales bacterium]|nr:hypothetical protein FACS189454_00820 [Planctomycetales bacterium]